MAHCRPPSTDPRPRRRAALAWPLLALALGELRLCTGLGHVGPPCQCFSICSQKDAEAFVEQLPRVIDSKRSPWWPYLQAVYKGAAPFPFHMYKLRLIWHNTPEWRAKHPDLWWPLHPCEPQPGYRKPARPGEAIMTQVGGLNQVRPAQPEPPRCPDCSGWLLPHESAPSLVPGVRFATWGRPNSSLSLQTWWAWGSDVTRFPAHSWVEVTRFARFPEGFRGYGQWFHPMIGTDIWVNIGRTFHARTKKLAFEALAQEWGKKWNAVIKGPQDVEKRVGGWVGIPGEPTDVLAFIGFDLGYDSIQVDNNYVPDFVITSPNTVVLDKCRPALDSPLRYKVVRQCGPRNLTCPYNVPLRTASLRVPCACDPKGAVINCDGTAADAGALAPEYTPADPREFTGVNAGTPSSWFEGSFF
jgi:hypothetical protein